MVYRGFWLDNSTAMCLWAFIKVNSQWWKARRIIPRPITGIKLLAGKSKYFLYRYGLRMLKYGDDIRRSNLKSLRVF